MFPKELWSRIKIVRYQDRKRERVRDKEKRNEKIYDVTFFFFHLKYGFVHHSSSHVEYMNLIVIY